uniref:Gpm554 n=1 Tax=Arundo donax TaxID=35708 RepID=A0A0A9DRK2_ARUDO
MRSTWSSWATPAAVRWCSTPTCGPAATARRSTSTTSGSTLPPTTTPTPSSGTPRTSSSKLTTSSSGASGATPTSRILTPNPCRCTPRCGTAATGRRGKAR